MLAPDGRVLDASPGLDAPLLTAAELDRAASATLTVERPRTPLGDEPVRLLATPVETARRAPRRRGRRRARATARKPSRAFASSWSSRASSRSLLAIAAGYAARRHGAAARRGDAPPRRLHLGGRRGRAAAGAGGERRDRRSRHDAQRDARPPRRVGRRERRFVADASHELRRPLALLKAEIEVALRGPADREALEAALRSAAEEADGLAQLADDLLLIARADQGAAAACGARRCASTTCSGAWLAATTCARGARGARSSSSCASGEPVDADRVRLEQALGNLVENALRHGAGTIALSARREGDAVVLAVSDEGAGFADDFRPHAFERFSRGDPSRTGGGAGLGLAIVETIAQAHGGAASTPNGAGGATVAITLPERRA